MRYKKTGELFLFEQLWEELPHICQVSGLPLPCKENSLWIWCFMHCLNKKNYDKARLSKENIILAHPSIHHIYDHLTHVAKKDKRFDWVFEKRENLKQKYFQGYFDKP